MPGRFANLEFDGVKRQQCQQTDTRPQRSAQDYLRAAEEEHHWARYEPALRLFTRALQEDRALIPAWVGQVQMLVHLGEYHEARVWSDKALELFRSNGELLAAQAQACARLGNRDAAVGASDASLQAPGGSPWRWIVRGEVLLAGRRKFADECFRKALAEPAAAWFDRVIIARVYRYHRQFAAALQYVKEALEPEPTQGCLWLELATCQQAWGSATAAAISYRRCLELRPDFLEARAALDALDRRGWLDWLGALLRRRPRP